MARVKLVHASFDGQLTHLNEAEISECRVVLESMEKRAISECKYLLQLLQQSSVTSSETDTLAANSVKGLLPGTSLSYFQRKSRIGMLNLPPLLKIIFSLIRLEKSRSLLLHDLNVIVWLRVIR
jgi:hypothetical protein